MNAVASVTIDHTNAVDDVLRVTAKRYEDGNAWLTIETSGRVEKLSFNSTEAAQLADVLGGAR